MAVPDYFGWACAIGRRDVRVSIWKNILFESFDVRLNVTEAISVDMSTGRHPVRRIDLHEFESQFRLNLAFPCLVLLFRRGIATLSSSL